MTALTIHETAPFLQEWQPIITDVSLMECRHGYSDGAGFCGESFETVFTEAGFENQIYKPKSGSNLPIWQITIKFFKRKGAQSDGKIFNGN